MALTDEQRAEVAEIGTKQTITVADRGKLMSLRYFFDASNDDRQAIDRALRVPPLDPPPEQLRTLPPPSALKARGRDVANQLGWDKPYILET